MDAWNACLATIGASSFRIKDCCNDTATIDLNIHNMRVNTFLIIISLFMAAFTGYLTYSIAEGKSHDVICGICSFICYIATLIPILGINYNSNRMGVNIRIMSICAFVVFLISHLCFAAYGITMPYYIIVNGLILMIYLALLYKMLEIKDV